MAEKGRQPGPPAHPTIWSALPRGRVLVLVPHPDDETLGCGGVLIQHGEQGDRIKVVFATDGAAGDALGYYAGLDYLELRREEARRAGAILGVEELVFWDYPDGRLAEADDLSERLSALLEADRPDIVYRPSTLEMHPDHWALAAASEAALQRYRPAVADFCYEIWATVQPSHAIDISAVWERKRKAIEQYQSQLRYNDYLRMIEGLNAFRTLYIPSARYVEAYRAGPHS
jgi:LmbE family N-acetylglucosaminyl deacetylase